MGLYLNEKWIYKEKENICEYCGKKTDKLQMGLCKECSIKITTNNQGA